MQHFKHNTADKKNASQPTVRLLQEYYIFSAVKRHVDAILLLCIIISSVF